MTRIEDVFFALVRAALKGENPETALTTMTTTEEEWQRLYMMAWKQSLLGVLFTVMNNMQMPSSVAMRWISDAEQIRGLNQLLNSEAARLTQLFADKGHRTAILKGQANAQLYPDPMSRQPGDIDIWVDGGRKKVKELLLSSPELGDIDRGLNKAYYHHVHLAPNEKGVTVEVHFRPSSGNFNPITNRRLQRWLEEEIKNTTSVSIDANSLQHFYVPSLRFALVMQLAHIHHHFLSSGIGLRQICDYYCLLTTSTESDRSAVSAILQHFGLHRAAEALMWVLHKQLGLDVRLMLCEADEWRGTRMLDAIMEGGNFGRFAPDSQKGVWSRFFKNKLRRLKMLRYDFWEVLWTEIRYWQTIVRTLPIRIKYRTLSLRDIPR